MHPRCPRCSLMLRKGLHLSWSHERDLPLVLGSVLGTWWLNKRAKLIMRGLPQNHSLPVFCAPSTLQSAQSTVPRLPLTQDHSFSITHFTEEETEPQKSEVTCQSQDWLGSGNEIPAPAPLSPQALTFREEGTWS